MTTVGYSTLSVIPEVKNLRAQLERQTSGDFTAAGKRAGQQFGDAAGKQAGSRFGATLKSAFAPAAGIIAGAGLIQGLRSVVDAGSEAQQAVGGVRAVFKEYADEVVRSSKRAEQGLGLSRTAYQQLATVTGALLKNQGIEDFTQQTEFLIKRGADLAATIGGPTKDAVEALTAAMRGESDPIERYGISLNETAVNAVLAANGQSKLTGAALTTAKAQARLVLIQQQSADAAGAFAREANTQEGQGARLSAQWQNMAATLGGDLLPVTQAFTSFLNNGALPALEGAGGLVSDAAHAFGELPAPIQAATGALIAFRAAQALGAGGLLSGGASLISRGLDDVRLRAMSLTDEYKRLRQGQLDIIAGSGKLTPAAGRVASALGAIEVAAIGAGRGLKSGLSGAINLVGGPWGAAFIGAAAVVTHFWQENQKAKQRVKDFTAALDEQTGALTENNRQQAIDALQKSGAFDDARKLGVGLGTLTDAALGSDEAIAQVTSHLDGLALGLKRTFDETGRGSNEMVATSQTIEDLRSAIGGQNDVVAEATQKWRDQREAMSGSADATAKTATVMRNYAGDIASARTEVQKLLDVENKRRERNLSAFQDQTRIQAAFDEARKEVAKGATTLNASTQAGRDNRDALAALADAWNSSANSVKNAKGAYADMRERFIKLADQLGATAPQAKKLADQLLSVPKKTPAEVTTPGMAAAIGRLKELNEQLRAAHRFARINLVTQVDKNRAQLADVQGRASGGMIYGRGTGTSDSNLIWASRGEFMQRKAAVDYYGVDFMRRLNALQIPKFAGGGLVGGSTTTVNNAGVSVAIDTVVAQDVNDFLTQVQRRTRLASLGGSR